VLDAIIAIYLSRGKLMKRNQTVATLLISIQFLVLVKLVSWIKRNI
jgi:hypothetical protein